MVKRKIGEIDLLRGISFLAIVLQHALASFIYLPATSQANALVSAFILLLIRFAVPMFVFITGLVLFYNHSDETLNYEQMVRRRFTQVFIPYLVWTMFYFVWVGLISGSGPRGEADILARIAQLTISGDGYYHLWFIVMILQFYLVFPLFRYVIHRGRSWAIATLLVSLGLYLAYLWGYHHLVPVLYERTSSQMIRAVMDYRDRLFVSWFFFFVMGGFAGLYVDKLRSLLRHTQQINWVVNIATFAIIFYQIAQTLTATPDGTYTINYQLTLPLSYTITIYLVSSVVTLYYLALTWLPRFRWLRRLLRTFGQCSFGCYFAHPFVLYYTDAFTRAIFAGFNTIVQVMITFTACSALTLLMSFGLSKLRTPVGDLFVGKVPGARRKSVPAPTQPSAPTSLDM